MTNNPKRPRAPAQLAKLIVDIATGEVENAAPTKKWPPKFQTDPLPGDPAI